MNIPSKYQQPAPGESGIWQRAQNVQILNDYGQVPTISFHEEKMAQVSGSIFPGPAVTDSLLFASLTTPDTQFQSVDGSTWTYAQLAAAITGLYFFKALERDNANQS